MAARGGGASSLKVKVVLLGEGAVGKTSIVLRYIENKFNDKHIQTLQVRKLAKWQPYLHFTYRRLSCKRT